jgi:streptothricin hydrolase
VLRQVIVLISSAVTRGSVPSPHRIGPEHSGRLSGVSTPGPWADALIVVDVQRGLVTGPHAVAHAGAYVERWTAALAAARAARVPVVHLRDAGRDPGSLIPLGSAAWELVLPVSCGEPVVGKEHDDGFVGTDLAQLLRRAGVTQPCLVGIQSEMCVAGTARGAMARGLTVVLPRDGHTTYAAPADGTAPEVPAAQVARVAEWSLGDRVVAPDRLADVRFRTSPVG